MTKLCFVNFNKDQNLDGVFTISDVVSIIKEIYFFPGKLLVELLGNTELGVFFELNFLSCTSTLTAVYCLFVWWTILGACVWSLKS